MNIPNAYGLEPRFALKSLSQMAIAQFIALHGFGFDLSSPGELWRMRNANIPDNLYSSFY